MSDKKKTSEVQSVLDRMMGHMEKGLVEAAAEDKALKGKKMPKPPKPKYPHNPFGDELLGD